MRGTNPLFVKCPFISYHLNSCRGHLSDAAATESPAERVVQRQESVAAARKFHHAQERLKKILGEIKE